VSCLKRGSDLGFVIQPKSSSDAKVSASKGGKAKKKARICFWLLLEFFARIASHCWMAVKVGHF
jgi:hypothetical protein